MQFRKKPAVIEAIQHDGYNVDEVIRFARRQDGMARANTSPGGSRMAVRTLDSLAYLEPDDWIIRGVHGEVYPCKPEIFAETYEPVEAP